MKAAAEAVLADPATEWEDCGTCMSDGPAVFMDSAEAGAELSTQYPDGGMLGQALVPLAAGRWTVRAPTPRWTRKTRSGWFRSCPLNHERTVASVGAVTRCALGPRRGCVGRRA
ncbi:Imm21 family immunity protein [Streptomyces bottropensis]|uniref:Imm21 family immunity protein n=1 Tax=Streptomyces bottropensis TaxID=42235 RepID=A0ABU8AYR6_9ACTN